MIVCLDLEGVLVPEVWINVAQKTGIEELRFTTRDIPDYDVLMKRRLEILARHKLALKDIQDVIATLRPLEGGREFLDWLRTVSQAVILSDTFAEFAQPLMRQLNWPTILCHWLEVDARGFVTNYRLRQKDQKKKAVRAFRDLHFSVMAVGDSYNDIAMLQEADQGVLFRPPENIVREFPRFPRTDRYDELKTIVEEFRARAH